MNEYSMYDMIMEEFVYLTHKQLQMHVWELSIIATNIILLKHQAITNHRAD